MTMKANKSQITQRTLNQLEYKRACNDPKERDRLKVAAEGVLKSIAKETSLARDN